MPARRFNPLGRGEDIPGRGCAVAPPKTGPPATSPLATAEGAEARGTPRAGRGEVGLGVSGPVSPVVDGEEGRDEREAWNYKNACQDGQFLYVYRL